MDKYNFIEEFSKYLVNKKASIFIGSGCSIESGYPSWKDLMKKYSNFLGLNINNETDLPRLAELYVLQNIGNRSSLNNDIKDAFRDNKGKPTAFHISLSNLPFSSIWTTNFDSLVERALEARQKKFNVVTNDKSYCDIDLEKEMLVHKIHGTFNKPSECVVTSSDYDMFFENNRIVSANLIEELCTKSFLFVGYSLNDRDIRDILKIIGKIYKENKPTPHYLIYKKVFKEEGLTDEQYNQKVRKSELEKNELAKIGVSVVEIDCFDEIPSILEQLRRTSLSKNVFLSGAYESTTLNIDHISSITQSICELLIKNGFSIYTGFGKNLGNDIITGSFVACASEDGGSIDGNNTFNKKVHVFPFPFKMKNGVKKTKLFKSIRNNVISNTTITIIISGEKSNEGTNIISTGCIDEVNVSKRQDNLIIPIGSTGGAAFEVWNKMKNDYNSNKLFLDLNSSDKQIVLNAVLSILEKGGY